MAGGTTEEAREVEAVQGESCSFADIPCHLSSFADWLLDILVFVPQKIWELILDGFATVIEFIPVPDFIAQIPSAFGGIPSGVWFFASALQLSEGLAIVLGAYILRFVIRRIPLFG